MLRKYVALFGLTLASTAALADPFRIDFEFAEPQGTARAVGYIVMESSLIQNPGVNDILLPSPAVLELSVTVTGAEAGNGTFGIEAFTGVDLHTNGGTLNFSQPLIGQATSGLPWGTSTNMGDAGDFNLFSFSEGEGEGEGREPYTPHASRGAGTFPPNGEWWFTLGANAGAANQMVLVSAVPSGFVAPHHPVPVDSRWALAALLSLTAAGAFVALRRRHAQ